MLLEVIAPLDDRCQEILDIFDEKQAIIVASGAISLGKDKLGYGFEDDSLDISDLQMLASLGQPLLIDRFKYSLEKPENGRYVHQILLTFDVFRRPDRIAKLNKHLYQILSNGRIPVINYDDSTDWGGIAEEEDDDNKLIGPDDICDNDRLGAYTASRFLYPDSSGKDKHVEDFIIMGHNYSGFYDLGGNVIPYLEKIEPLHHSYCEGKSSVGTGGMRLKLDAMEMFLKYGLSPHRGIITRYTNSLDNVFSGNSEMTQFGGHYPVRKVA